MIDRRQQSGAQQLRQLPGIDPVTFVARLEQDILARIAHHHLGNVRFQQVVQPSGPSPFFKGHIQIPTQPLERLHNRRRLRFDNRLHPQLAGRIHDGDRSRFLVNIHTDILVLSIRCSFR